MENLFKAPVDITNHRNPYDRLSPTRPDLSQNGRTILVCGGSTGIGHGIARGFCAAGADKVIVLGRRSDVLLQSVAQLSQSYPKTKVIAKICDVTVSDQLEALWNDFAATGVLVDVVILSAVGTPALQPILEQGVQRLWKDYESNVLMPLRCVQFFHDQKEHTKEKFCIYVSSFNTYNWEVASEMPGYQLTKNAMTAALQIIARDTPAEKMQVVSFHPSFVFTEAARKTGYKEDTLPWTSEDVPGCFAVWAATAQARFLHGRFVWATWDVDELMSGEMRKRINEDPWFLKVGVKGF